MVASAIGSHELAARTAAIRGAQICATRGSEAGGDSHSISEATFAPCRSPSACPIMPPIDRPTKWTRPIPSASTTCAMSPANWSSVVSPSGEALPPWPRMSTRSTR